MKSPNTERGFCSWLILQESVVNERAFLDAMFSDPRDPSSLLVYADYLEEGNLDQELADMIRLTVGHRSGQGRKRGRRTREDDLRHRHLKGRKGPLWQRVFRGESDDFRPRMGGLTHDNDPYISNRPNIYIVYYFWLINGQRPSEDIPSLPPNTWLTLNHQDIDRNQPGKAIPVHEIPASALKALLIWLLHNWKQHTIWH